jgi:hypothetical protein
MLPKVLERFFKDPFSQKSSLFYGKNFFPNKQELFGKSKEPKLLWEKRLKMSKKWARIKKKRYTASGIP